MSTTKGIPNWEETVYLFEENDPVQGGPDGVDNKPLKQLANRTAFLNQELARLKEVMPGSAEYNAILDRITGLSQQIANYDVAKLNNRTDHLERLVSNMGLALDAKNMYPDSDALVVENFDNPDQVDMAVITVTSIVSGDDSVDVDDITNIVVGAHYTLTDGENQEEVQIKSTHVAGGTNRLILIDPVVKQYISGRARLYRSSVAIFDGKAFGGGNVKTQSWEPHEIFKGSVTAIPMPKSVLYNEKTQSDFTSTGMVFENGKMILGSRAVGIALVTSGGGAGTWQQVNSEGDNA